MSERSYRSLVVGVAGYIAHEALTARVDAVTGVSILRSSLHRVGSRKRRIDAPAYESRIVVASVDLGDVNQSFGYRGVSRCDLDLLAQELAGLQRTVDSASVRFTAQAHRPEPLESLLAAIEAAVAGSGGSMMGSVTDSASVTGYELPGQVTDTPGTIEALVVLLKDSGAVDPWNLHARWFDQRRERAA